MYRKKENHTRLSLHKISQRPKNTGK